MRPTRFIGWLLTIGSLLAIIQSIREFRIESSGQRNFASEDLYTLPFVFAGHTFAVVDDQPRDMANGSLSEYEGIIQLVEDGRRVGPWSHAMIRRNQRGLSRYYGWLSIWKVQERATGQTTLWLARRIQPSTLGAVRVEVTTVSQSGAIDRRVLRPWQLGANYPLWRASSWVAAGTVGPFSLSALSFMVFPPMWLLFPIGTLVAGVVLLLRTRGQQAVERTA